MKKEKLNKNGCTTTNAPGSENYERYRDTYKKMYLYQYDYRHTDGELFSTVATNLEKCRERRDIWLNEKLSKNEN